MPLMSSRILRERAEAGVEVCVVHGPPCPKYPDHPLLRERSKLDMDGVVVIRRTAESPPPCKPRKLSDEQIRQRSEWAKVVREARLRKGLPDPTPPWEREPDSKLEKKVLQGRAEQARQFVPDTFRRTTPPAFEEEE